MAADTIYAQFVCVPVQSVFYLSATMFFVYIIANYFWSVKFCFILSLHTSFIRYIVSPHNLNLILSHPLIYLQQIGKHLGPCHQLAVPGFSIIGRLL